MEILLLVSPENKEILRLCPCGKAPQWLRSGLMLKKGAFPKIRTFSDNQTMNKSEEDPMYLQKVNKLDFTDQCIYVGLDVHKKNWKVAIYHDYGFYKSFSQDPDPKILMQYLRRTFPGGQYHVVYESGCFGFWIAHQLQALGVHCIVTHPADVPTTDKQKRRKTDRVDANKLAQELRADKLTPLYVPAISAISDRMLVRTRAKMVKNQTRLKNQIKSLLTFMGIPVPFDSKQHWSRQFMHWLQTLDLPQATATASLKAYLVLLEDTRNQLADLTRQVRQLARQPTYQPLVELLMSIPGVGPITSMVLIVELIDMHRFKNLDKLCGYVGLVPDIESTGQTTHVKGLTKRANTYVKHMIIEASWVAIAKDPALMSDYSKLIMRMKKQHAIIRMARKLLARVRFVWMHEKPYQHSYQPVS